MTPQSFVSSYAPRLRTYGNSLLTPVVPPTTTAAPGGRTTKRGTTAINYAENDFEDDDIFEDNEPRRATGLRSRREDPNTAKEAASNRLGKELYRPVEVQGIWREWIGKGRPLRYLRPPMATKDLERMWAYTCSLLRSDKQRHFQNALPLTLIPIRIDLDIAPFIPHPALPIPPDAQNQGINPALPAYRPAEQTPTYRLKDFFLWNLHETLITPDQFATALVHDLDLPGPHGIIGEISKQIRSQLEEYAGIALHPLFHTTDTSATINGNGKRPIRGSMSRENSYTPATPRLNGLNGLHGLNGVNGTSSPSKATPARDMTKASATAELIPPDPSHPPEPDDAYRCMVNLNINLSNKLYTDKFEWSLLHPVGVAETFAKRTCSDMNLIGEWVPAIAHAIYEAVLRLKKEACESGGLVGSINGYGGEIDNQAASESGSGWRYDHETLGVEWEPSLEILSKEEIEKKEGDRERQLRRLRRETARFSSTSNMIGGLPDQRAPEEETLGRGERSKKKRRFRSLSPQEKSASEVGAVGFGGGGLSVLADW